MRVLLWILGIPALLLTLAVVLIPMLLDEQALVELAAAQIKEKSGVILRVDGDASLSLFPKVALSATDINVSIPENNTLVEAEALSVGVALWPLLSGGVEVDSIMIDGLTLTSEAEDEEAARAAAIDTSTLSNAELDAYYAARAQARKSAQAEAAAGILGVPLALEVKELSLRNIRLVTVDKEGVRISEVQLTRLSAKDLNLDGRPVPMSADVLLPGTDGAEDIRIAAAGEFTPNLKPAAASTGKVDIQVTGATPEPIAVSASYRFTMDTQIADLELDLASGSLSGKGTLRYARFDSPQIDADLALTELNPALLVLAGPDAAVAAEDSGTVDADAPLPLHAIRMIDSRAKLRIATVVLDAHRLNDVQATLRVVDGVATLDPVTAKVHGGDIRMTGIFNARYNQATLRTEGTVSGLDVAQATAAMDAGVQARGSASLTWSLNGQGRSGGELSRSLTGPVSFRTEDITIADIAMEKMVCEGVALVNQEPLNAEFPTDTQFQALSADIQLANGVATLDPLTARLAAIGLSGKGTLDIETQDLKAGFRAQLSPALGEMDPACRINERYTQLRWPVECKGNLADDPAGWCGINTAEIVKDLAEGELKRKATDEAGKLFNKLFKRN
jgi:uncharacterized protein involved in outer membrane biogenesis